jgi:O-succinylbenzoate synthase
MWKLQHRPYRLPFRQIVRTGHGHWAEREGWLLRATREIEGRAVVGWGEAAPISWFGTESVKEAGEALAGLEGRAESLADALGRVPASCACVRGALAAALGREAGAAGAAVSALPVAGLLPAGRAALAAVEPRLELGFRVFKWKVGVLPAADEWALLDDLLGRLPAGAKLRLDANGAWDRRTAEGWLARAAERPVEYVEQPVSPEARGAEDLLHGLAADYPVKVALDESVNGAGDVERWLAADWRGVWVLKPALLGEPEPVLARLAKAGADVVFGSALETAVGARAALRLAFAWAEARGGEAAARRALGFGVWPLFADARADAPLAGPFARREDVERINPEALWNALG